MCHCLFLESRAEHQDKAEIGFEQQPPASSIICWTRLICSPSHLELKPISNHSSCLLSHLSSHNIRLGVLTKLSYSEATSWWKMLVFKSNFMPNFFTYCLTDFPFPCLEMEKKYKTKLVRAHPHFDVEAPFLKKVFTTSWVLLALGFGFKSSFYSGGIGTLFPPSTSFWWWPFNQSFNGGHPDTQTIKLRPRVAHFLTQADQTASAPLKVPSLICVEREGAPPDMNGQPTGGVRG